jgi:hypothetical protein
VLKHCDAAKRTKSQNETDTRIDTELTQLPVGRPSTNWLGLQTLGCLAVPSPGFRND